MVNVIPNAGLGGVISGINSGQGAGLVPAGQYTLGMAQAMQNQHPPTEPIPQRSQRDQWEFESGLIRQGKLDQVEALYPEAYQRAGHPLFFHFSVWEANHGEAHPDYGFLNLATFLDQEDLFTHKTLLVFGSKESRRAFRKWWKSYQRFFEEGTIETMCLPTLAATKRVKGAIIPYVLPHDDFSHGVVHTGRITVEARDVWAWIVANCRARVWRLPGAFVFANDTDAVAFKLRWH